MARYRGTIRGNRGEASRLGSPSSGLNAHIASWDGAVAVALFPNPNNEEQDYAEVALTTHYGVGARKVLYRGPVGVFEPDVLAVSPQVQAVIDAVTLALPDLEHYAGTHGEGPNHRLAALKVALSQVGVR